MKTTIKRGQLVRLEAYGVFGRVVGVQRKTGLVHIKTRKAPSCTGLTWMFGAEELTKAEA